MIDIIMVIRPQNLSATQMGEKLTWFIRSCIFSKASLWELHIRYVQGCW